MKHLVAVLLILLVGTACDAESDETPTETGTVPAAESITPTSTPAATQETQATSPSPSSTPKSTNTSAPTNTPTPTSTPEPTATPLPPTATPEPTATATPVPPPQSILTSGVGDTLTESIPLAAGLAVFTLNHDGASNFAIWFHEESTGERLDLLVNEIGPFSGRIAIEIPVDSNYLYDVTANGNWSIEVIQPSPANWEVINAPVDLTGSGRDVRLFIFMESGLRRVELTHDGSSNFAIWIYNSDASGRDLIVNEIGPYDGSTGVQVGSGGIFAVFDIEADGNWTINVQ